MLYDEEEKQRALRDYLLTQGRERYRYYYGLVSTISHPYGLLPKRIATKHKNVKKSRLLADIAFCRYNLRFLLPLMEPEKANVGCIFGAVLADMFLGKLVPDSVAPYLRIAKEELDTSSQAGRFDDLDSKRVLTNCAHKVLKCVHVPGKYNPYDCLHEFEECCFDMANMMRDEKYLKKEGVH